MDGYVGEIKMFAGTFAPLNWVFCSGQMLPISAYNTLFALIGTQFGGDGTTTFGVPDLRGRIPIGAGTGPGLSSRTPGNKGGAETVTLTINQLPSHTHNVKCDTTTTSPTNTPLNNLPAVMSSGTGYGPTVSASIMKSDMLNPTGSGQQHDNMPPWGCINYIMCAEGLWPPQN
jgi:microcystin-dependent protein